MSANAPHLKRGEAAEKAALEALKRRGLKLIVRNYRCPLGEIDLICEDGATLAFVEVRYRASRRYGVAAATVDARKQQKLIRAAGHFLQKHPQHRERPARFDVVAVEGDAMQVDWIPDAFQTRGLA